MGPDGRPRGCCCAAADGWHCVVVDDAGGERRTELSASGTRWNSGARNDPEPVWWRQRLAETAGGLRGLIAEALTDATFGEFGAEAAISWFAVDDPVDWEGLVTLGEPDPARFPGRVPPFVVTLEPGRGAVLPDAHLLFSTRAADAWATLDAVAELYGAPAPRDAFVCGFAGHRSVRVGRGSLALSTEEGADGVERLAEIVGTRGAGWGGNPELRLRLDGVDLLDDPAADVVTLFRDLGHDVVERGRTARIPAMGLNLHEPDRPGPRTGRFTTVALQFPSAPDAVR
ncbi:hypothetical protein BJF79_10670 [Actinomadura sp. CNU-125]|uniref:hypothetical protein n=1 Tax=Actinomadura sp. CNU-125 TaxID=1904961 RepID=UPI000962AE16|nr:hypothetical protein [Actinomadura sp. CNU-125]OLT28960.1 hypothetical protein BJF79_10670 [Actinomadura sp. CNU-125]